MHKILFALLSLSIMLLSCKKDPSSPASKSDCKDACDHGAELTKNRKDILDSVTNGASPPKIDTETCLTVCFTEQQWPVQTTSCMSDANDVKELFQCPRVDKAAAAHIRRARIQESNKELDRAIEEEKRKAAERQ
jgi:hypothetical protein